MRVFKRAVDILVAIMSREFTAWLVLILMVVVLFEVVTRYVMHNPFGIADEFGAYIVVAIVCLGLAYTWKEKGHIRIEFVISRLSPKVRDWVRLVTLIMATAITVVLVWSMYERVAYSFDIGAKSGSHLNILIQWPQLVLVIGTVLVFLQIVVELINVARKLKAPEGEG